MTAATLDEIEQGSEEHGFSRVSIEEIEQGSDEELPAQRRRLHEVPCSVSFRVRVTCSVPSPTQAKRNETKRNNIEAKVEA